MSELTKKRPTKSKVDFICIIHEDVLYRFPRDIAEKYRVDEEKISPDEVFSAINAKYSKPGALLRGIRARENLTQVKLAKLLKITQSDVSQIENGTRKIGRMIAKRIEKLFGVHYRSFLE